MSSSQFKDKKDHQEKTATVDLVSCIKENKYNAILKYLIEKNQHAVLKNAIDSNILFYDLPMGNETLLNYVIKNSAADQQTCDLFIEQREKIEKCIQEIKTILFNIINNPTQITEKDLSLYKNCRTFNDALRKRVLGDKNALQSMQQDNSLLRQVLPTLEPKQALTNFTRYETAFQNNDIFYFDEKFIANAKTNPEFLNLLMLQYSTEKEGQTLPEKLRNYAYVYSPRSPLAPLFKPEFQNKCKELAKRLTDETLEFADKLSTRSHEALVRYRTIIVAAFETVDSVFLEECLSLLDNHPTEKIHIEAREAVSKNDAARLVKILENKEFKLLHPYRHQEQETLLLHTLRSGHPACLTVLLTYIREKSLNNIQFTTADCIFALLSAPHPQKCLDVLSEAKRLEGSECENIVFNALKEFDNTQKDKKLLASLKHAKIGVYHCSYAIKFPLIKCFVVPPDSPLHHYLSEQRKDLKAILERDHALIQQVKEDKLESSAMDFEDLKIKNREGKLLIEIAAECKSEKAIALLTAKKKQQGFAHQLMSLEGDGLYTLVMNGSLDLKEDKEFLDFFASTHPTAQKARLTLITFIRDHICIGSILKTVKHNEFDPVIQLFSIIYKEETSISDKKEDGFRYANGTPCSWLEALLAGLNEAKATAEQYFQECQQADEIYKKLLQNKLTPKELYDYSINWNLLVIIKNKLIDTKTLKSKMINYEALFHPDPEDPIHQLYKIFRGFRFIDVFDPQSYRNLLLELKEDWMKTKTQYDAEQAFENGVKELIEAKRKTSSVRDEQNVIPLADMTKKEWKESFSTNYVVQKLEIKETKRSGVTNQETPQQTDQLFAEFISGKATNAHIQKYCNNIALLKLFRDKILQTTDRAKKILLYDQLFSLTYEYEDRRPLDRLFHFYQLQDWWETSTQRALLFELEVDLNETVELMTKEQEQNAAFEAGVLKLIEKANSKKRYVGRYRDSIPLMELPPKEQRLGLFKPKPNAFEDELTTAEPSQSPYVASIKRIPPPVKKIEKEKDDLDEQIAKMTL